MCGCSVGYTHGHVERAAGWYKTNGKKHYSAACVHTMRPVSKGDASLDL